MHFSSDLNLNWVKTLGGKGEDWVEESAIDSKGNFYIAVGTNSPIKDSFWDMEFNPKYLFRRMLIKLNKKGDLIYNNCLYGKVKATGLYTKENHPFKYNNTLNEFINCNGFSLISLQFEYLYQLLCRISDDSLNNNTRNETITQEFLSKM
jgi:hypothetical protein